MLIWPVCRHSNIKDEQRHTRKKDLTNLENRITRKSKRKKKEIAKAKETVKTTEEEQQEK